MAQELREIDFKYIGKKEVDSKSSHSILSALGDESSRKILCSSIGVGKTVEQISAEQNLPLSTCYRRVRRLVDEGLMILERIVVTQAGKRYAVYRSSISEATVRLNDGEISMETTPNPDALDKLLTRWLTSYYPMRSQKVESRPKARTYSHT